MLEFVYGPVTLQPGGFWAREFSVATRWGVYTGRMDEALMAIGAHPREEQRIIEMIEKARA